MTNAAASCSGRHRSADGSLNRVIIGTALVGAAVGGVSGHLWRGMSRADVKEFGDIIDSGQAALVVVGEGKLQQALDKAALKAEKHAAKELGVSPKDIDEAVREAAGEVS